MSEKLVSVYEAAGQVEANFIKSLLEAEGIPAEIYQESAGKVMGLWWGDLGRADIVVPEEYEVEALELLAKMGQSGLLPEEDDTPDNQNTTNPDEGGT